MHQRLAALCLAVVLPACSDLDVIDIPITAETPLLEGVPLELGEVWNDHELEFPNFTRVQLAERSELKSKGVTVDDVKTVKLLSLKIRLLPEASKATSIDFIEEVTVYVRAPGLEERRVASGTIPEGATESMLDVDDKLDLKPWVTAEEMGISVRVTGRPPAEDAKIRARALFEVDAGVL